MSDTPKPTVRPDEPAQGDGQQTVAALQELLQSTEAERDVAVELIRELLAYDDAVHGEQPGGVQDAARTFLAAQEKP